MKTRATALALAAFALPDQAQEEAPIMDITRKAELTTTEGPADYFTGHVTITGQFQRPAPDVPGHTLGGYSHSMT